MGHCRPFTTQEAARYAARLSVTGISAQEWTDALNIELEHCQTLGGSRIAVARIARDHITEYPDYYQRLKKMEQQAERYWKGRSRT